MWFYWADALPVAEWTVLKYWKKFKAWLCPGKIAHWPCTLLIHQLTPKRRDSASFLPAVRKEKLGIQIWKKWEVEEVLCSWVSLCFLITSPVRAVAKYYDEHICLCVCLFVWQDISGDTHAIFTKFFMHVAYHRGSVLLWQGDKIPGGTGNFGGFPPRCQCIVTHSLQITSSSSSMNHSVATEGDGIAQHSEQKGLFRCCRVYCI